MNKFRYKGVFSHCLDPTRQRQTSTEQSCDNLHLHFWMWTEKKSEEGIRRHWYLLSVGANAADEERFCSVKSLQKFGQRGLEDKKKSFFKNTYFPHGVLNCTKDRCVELTWNWALMLGGFFFLCRCSRDLVVRSCSVRLTMNFRERESSRFCEAKLSCLPTLTGRDSAKMMES